MGYGEVLQEGEKHLNVLLPPSKTQPEVHLT